MVVIGFSIVNTSQEFLIQQRTYHREMSAESALETDCCLNSVLLNRLSHGLKIFKGDGDGFFDNQVFTGFGGRDSLFRVEWMGCADVDHIDAGVSQHRVIVRIRL